MARKGALVEMTTADGPSSSSVARWPSDAAAHRALAEYLQVLPADPAAERTAATVLNGWGVDFTGADLSGLDLLGAELGCANMSRVVLIGADLYTASLGETRLDGADLSGADLRKVQGRGCKAQYANLSGANLQRADFAQSNFRGAVLRGAQLQRVTFSGADLREADLRDGVFERTRLSRARMGGCRVAGASGQVIGPVDVGVDTSKLLDGPELREWFSANGAPSVEVRPSA